MKQSIVNLANKRFRQNKTLVHEGIGAKSCDPDQEARNKGSISARGLLMLLCFCVGR